MYYTAEYPIIPSRFPTDKCVIRTHVRLKDAVGDCPSEQLDNLPTELRSIVHHKKNDAKNDRESAFNTNSKNRYNPTIPICVIFIRGFHGIQLHAEKLQGLGWMIYMITFNPASVCHAHNGRVIEEEHFIHACSDLVQSVAPLLEDSDDSVHLIPGIHPESRAYWKSLEIPFQILDANGLILRAFDNAKHPEINIKPLYKCQNESIAFGNSTRDLTIRVYRKDVQLKTQRKRQVTSDTQVLRVEVSLSGAKLGKHFRGGTWKVINGDLRLVSFRANDLRAAFLSVMSKFSGVFYQPSAEVDQIDNKTGRMMGWVAKMTGLTVETQLNYFMERFLGKNQKPSIANARSRLHKAARKELEIQSTVKLTDLYNDDAWHYQPAVVCAALESMEGDRHMNVTNHPLIEATYGTRKRSIHPTYGSSANA